MQKELRMRCLEFCSPTWLSWNIARMVKLKYCNLNPNGLVQFLNRTALSRTGQWVLELGSKAVQFHNWTKFLIRTERIQVVTATFKTISSVHKIDHFLYDHRLQDNSVITVMTELSCNLWSYAKWYMFVCWTVLFRVLARSPLPFRTKNHCSFILLYNVPVLGIPSTPFCYVGKTKVFTPLMPLQPVPHLARSRR